MVLQAHRSQPDFPSEHEQRDWESGSLPERLAEAASTGGDESNVGFAMFARFRSTIGHVE
jgi:hypothetical protein